MKNTQKGFILPLIIIIFVIGAGIYFYSKNNTKQSNNTIQNSQLSLDKINNAQFKDFKLTNGKYQYTFEEGKVGASQTANGVVEIRDNNIAYGDLNEDGANDVAVILVKNTGGTGSFYSLNILLNKNTQPVYTDQVDLGDRPIINSVTIKGNKIMVDMVTQGPGDGMCCPTMKEVRTFSFVNNKLTEEITDESTPVVTFTGYHIVQKGVYGEENTGPKDCDAFVVYKSPDPLFKFLANWSPQAVDANGNLSLTLELGKLANDTRQKIISSTKAQLISLTVQKRFFWGKGLPLCGSVVDIISAK